MEQDITSRPWMIALRILSVIVSALLLLWTFGNSINCNITGATRECAFVSNSLIFFNIANLVLLVFLCSSSYLSKEKFQYTIIIYLLFILVAFYIPYSLQRGNALYNSLEDSVLGCKIISMSSSATYCYTDLAKAKNDISFCEKTKDNGYLSGCYSYFAVKDSEPSLCPQDDHYCFVDVAAKVSDRAVCEKITHDSVKQICYVEVAKTANDPVLCERSNEAYNLNLCQALMREVADTPESFVSAVGLDATFEIINHSLKVGQKDVDFIEIKAKTTSGLAILSQFDIAIEGGSIFDIFNNLKIYEKQNDKYFPVTGSGSFSAEAERPSWAHMWGSVFVFPNQVKTFVVRADVNSESVGANLKLILATVKTLGKTKVSTEVIGNQEIKISK